MTRSLLLLALLMGGASLAYAEPCQGELCPRDTCWDAKLKKDICTKIPQVCPPQSKPQFKFLDDGDGTKDGQLVALGSKAPFKGCGTLTVTKTGYYKIFDTELSESCTSQRDETGYVTISNSCNPEGWALEANLGKRYVVLDSDNTKACNGDKDCGNNRVCRKGTHGKPCCVPSKPTFMGTFLLVAGEKNKICLNHLCPEWRAEKKKGKDIGFITAGCSSIDSIHFRLDTNAIACVDNTRVKPCSACNKGQCLPDPCDKLNCPKYCKDGKCTDTNPCATITCQHGCKNGQCLSPQNAPGKDKDGDGYVYTADCDDNDPKINPGAPELCNNGKDDNCDGQIDEKGCQGSVPKPGDGGSSPDGGSSSDSGGPGNDGGPDPCAAITCQHGCQNGRCLPPPQGTDTGGNSAKDGGSTHGDANPCGVEICGNGKDDDCDGSTDELECTPGPGSAAPGCNCQSSSSGVEWIGALLLLFLLGLRRRSPG